MNLRTLKIDITPTWSGLLPSLLALLECKNLEARKTAQEELTRMARAADLWNASIKKKGGR